MQFGVITYPDTSKELYSESFNFKLHLVFRVCAKCPGESRAAAGGVSPINLWQRHKQVHANSTLTLHANGLRRMGLKSYLIDLIADDRLYHRCQGGGRL